MNQAADPDAPPGWSCNPSAWPERAPIVALALLGFVIALYLALYQWRMVEDVWEPFFGDGSLIILDSPVSHLFPVPDAALGALGYLLAAAAGAAGGRRRWQTMPWMVALFGIAEGLLGVMSLLLVILQPVLFDAWCTLCLASSVVSAAMIGPATDEILASLQFLLREKGRGRSFWRAFWGARE
ncbi:MAG: vitamin K epoxide reductase [Elusimicrobia bacterium]|nr:vitamin K epoxide reductase [Elusimicrobiota bacterium]